MRLNTDKPTNHLENSSFQHTRTAVVSVRDKGGTKADNAVRTYINSHVTAINIQLYTSWLSGIYLRRSKSRWKNARNNNRPSSGRRQLFSRSNLLFGEVYTVNDDDEIMGQGAICIVEHFSTGFEPRHLRPRGAPSVAIFSHTHTLYAHSLWLRATKFGMHGNAQEWKVYVRSTAYNAPSKWFWWQPVGIVHLLSKVFAPTNAFPVGFETNIVYAKTAYD